jgi:peroxiredoxin
MSRFFRALTALMLSVVAYAQSPPAHPLPYVPVKTTDAKGINLHKFLGKELIIVVFSTQCEDCITTIGVLSKIQKELGPRGLQVVGIAGNENAAYTVGPFAERYKPGFPLGFLNQDAVIKLTNIKKDDRPFVPIVMFVDSVGVVRVQYFGNDPVMKQQEKALRAIADSLLKWQANRAASAKAAAAPKPETPPPAKPEP